MRKITLLLAALVLTLTAGAAFAQDGEAAETDLEAGFRLGKFYMSTNMLASDLEIIQVLNETFELEQITDENYEAGVITDDDLAGAQMYLGYALWRLQFLVLPVCEAGLDDESFSEGSIAPFKDETQALLSDLAADVNEFLAVGDFATLDRFVEATLEAGYVSALADLSARAQAAAGVEEEGPEAAEEAPAEPEE